MIVEGKYVQYSNSDPGTRQHYTVPFSLVVNFFGKIGNILSERKTFKLLKIV